MDTKFQDRTDDYLLGRMNDADKEAFLREVELDNEKKEQLEFTKNVKAAICSREEKLRALAQFQQRYEEERRRAALRSAGTEAEKFEQPASASRKKRTWLWISSAAAVLVAGFFAVRPMLVDDASPVDGDMPKELLRGGNDVFSPAPADTTDNDTIKCHANTETTPNE